MVDIIVPDYPFEEGDEVVVLVSGLGATPIMELYVLYDEIDELLKAKGSQCQVDSAAEMTTRAFWTQARG